MRLSASDLKDRVESWNQLIGGGIVECDWVPGGVRVRAVPGFQRELAELVELERGVLSWIQFKVTQEGSEVTTAAEESVRQALRPLFPGPD